MDGPGDYHTQFSSIQLLSCVRLFVTSWTAARQASLSIANSQSLLKLMSIELVMPSNHLILCCPLLLPPSIFPHIRVFSNESVPRIRWPKYWSFNFNINPSNEYSGLDLNPVLASGTHSKSVDSMNGLIFSDHFLGGRHSSKLGHFILIKSMTVL